MNIDDIKTICVIGAGNMGHQISVHLALFGFNTACMDISSDALRKAEEFAHSYLKGRVAKGKLAEIVAATVLCGELSLLSAILAHDWVSSHEKYGRNR
jgi:3-hydroxybutyryl-CoA dehydrogenase